MGWIDPTALATMPPHGVISFMFAPFWLALVGGLVLSILAIATDRLGRRRRTPGMKRPLLGTAGPILLPSSHDGQLLPSSRKG